MQWLKQSTAVSKVVGPILDSDGAEYASAVIGDISLSKNGGSLTALASAATLTYIANGMYTLALTTGNTDTLGSAEISCNKSTYQMPPREFMVLPATVYDALVTNATTAAGGLGDVQRVAGATQTARDLGASVLLSVGTGTGQVNLSSGKVPATVAAGDLAADCITSAALAASAVTEIQTAVTGGAYALSTDANGRMRVVDGTGAGEIDTTSGKVNALLDASDVTGNVSAVLADGVTHGGTTAKLRLGGSGLTPAFRCDNASGNAVAFTSTSTGIGAGLQISNGASSLSAALDISSTGTVAAVRALASAADALQFNATGSGKFALNGVASGGATYLSTGLAAEFWTVPPARTLTGLGFTLGASDFAANSLTASALATDAVQEIRDAITGGAYAFSTDANGRVRVVDGTAAGEIDTSSGRVQLTEAQIDQIVDEVWDEVQSGHTTAGTFGKYLDAAVSGVSTGGVSAADIADAVWDEVQSGHTTAGTFGRYLDTQLATIAGYIDTEVATIVSRIGVPASSLAADIAALNDVTAAEVWAAGSRTLTAGTNIVLAKGVGVTGFNDLSAAAVNAEVVDCLSVDTYAEPTGVPSATVSLAAKVGRLYKALTRKVTVAADALTFYDASNAAEWAKPTSDDSTTYTEAAASAP